MIFLSYCKNIYMIVILILFIMLSSKTYCNLIHIDKTGGNNIYFPPKILVSNVDSYARYNSKRNNDKNLKERFHSLNILAANLDITFHKGHDYGFIRIFVNSMFKKKFIEEEATDIEIYHKIERINDQFKNIIHGCLDVIKKIPENYEDMLFFVVNKPDKFPCITKNMSLLKLPLQNFKKSRCWNQCDAYIKDVIFLYLKSTCKAISRIQPKNASVYYLCCMDFISSYMMNFEIENIPLDRILNFNTVKSCQNRDVYAQINQIMNINSFGFYCTEYPEFDFKCKDLEECKHKSLIKKKNENKIHQALNIVESNCKKLDPSTFNLETDFFDFITIIGFVFSLLVSILLFYFRF